MEQSDAVQALRAIHSITASTRLDPADTLADLVDLGLRWFALDRGLLARRDESNLRTVVARGGGEELGFGAALAGEPLARTLTTTEPVCYVRARGETVGQQPVGAYIGVRVRIGDRGLGVLAFFSEGERTEPFSETDEEIVKLMAQWAGAALWRHETLEGVRELERQVQRSQSLETVGRLVSEIAHDFNNLLMGIRGAATLALEGSADPRQLREVLRCTDQGERLTKQLLRFSQRRAVEHEPVDVDEVLVDLSLLLERLAGRGVTVEHRPSGNAVVVGDRGQLEQVVVNLVVNARDAMPEGGRVVVDTSAVALNAERAEEIDLEAGSYVMLSVSDDGVGIEPQLQDRIFDAFFTTRADDGGSGMGLSVVRGIVEEMGGRIRVLSEPGRGSRFELLLPAAEVTAVPASSLTASAEPARAPALTVLVVDDNEATVDAIAEYLREAGLRVLPASDPAVALALWQEHGAAIDVLLSDYELPGMTGRQLADRLQDDRASLRVVLMSGHEEIDGGGAPVFKKPIHLDTLLAAVVGE